MGVVAVRLPVVITPADSTCVTKVTEGVEPVVLSTVTWQSLAAARMALIDQPLSPTHFSLSPTTYSPALPVLVTLAMPRPILSCVTAPAAPTTNEKKRSHASRSVVRRPPGGP